MKLNTILFAAKGELHGLSAKLGVPIELNNVSSPNFGIAKCHPDPTGRLAGSGKKAKLSTFAYFCEMLTGENVFALELQDNSVYVEYTGIGGTNYAGTFNGSVMHFYGDVPGAPVDLIAPIAAYALSSFSPMDETKENFVAFTTKMNDGSTTSEVSAELFRSCDALYYEGVAVGHYFPDDIDVDNKLLIETVREAIRTGGAKFIANLLPGGEFASYPSRPADPREVQFNEDPAATAAASTTASSAPSKFDSMKNGDYILNTYWDANRRGFIPPLSRLDGFVPCQAFYMMADRIKAELDTVLARMDDGLFGADAIQDNYVNVQFVGRPGTGKSTIAEALAATFGMPIRIVPISKHTEEDTFTGMTKVQEGGFTFVETPFLDAFKNGGIIVLEEYNLGDPGVLMGALGQAIEKPFLLLEDGYREVRRHPLCVIIATMNTGTQGSREPSEALTSRLPGVFLLDDPNEDEFVRILRARSGQKKDVCKKVYGIYKKVLAYLTSDQINEEQVALSITLRSCLDALKQIGFGVPIRDAIKNTIIGAIAIKDIELSKDVLENVVMVSK